MAIFLTNRNLQIYSDNSNIRSSCFQQIFLFYSIQLSLKFDLSLRKDRVQKEKIKEPRARLKTQFPVKSSFNGMYSISLSCFWQSVSDSGA